MHNENTIRFLIPTRQAFGNILRLLVVTVSGLTIYAAGMGCSAMTPGRLDAVTPVTNAVEKPRVGSVYLLRGFIGVFSTGIDSLGQQINDRGIHAEVFQESQTASLAAKIAEVYKTNASREPLVLVGHSYGADSTIRVARALSENGITVDLIVTLDPVTPPKVPENVTHVVNLYQSNGAFDALPWLRGIALTPETEDTLVLENINIRTDRTDLLEPGTDHFNIEKKSKIQSEVIARVLEVCIERPAWAANQNRLQLAGLASRSGGLGDKATPSTRPAATR